MIEQTLQKLTESQRKVEELFTQKRITKDDLKRLSDKEHEYLKECIENRMSNLKGGDLDKFLVLIDDILVQSTKNEIWEHNHRLIIKEITSFINDCGRMPLKLELVHRTGLSRQTLNKHFKEYKNNPIFIEHTEQFQFMVQKVLAKMFQFAMEGNVKAAKVFLDMVGESQGRSTQIRDAYIQINNMVISEERLRALNPDQLGRIEEILMEVPDIKVSGGIGGYLELKQFPKSR
jgi:hypothetical protein